MARKPTQRIALAALTAGVALIGCVGAALGATTVGQTPAPTSSTVPAPIVFQLERQGLASVGVPSAGVITSFSHLAEASPDATLQLVVLRPVGADFQVVGVSSPQTLVGGLINTFPEQIPVEAGDLIGLQGSNLGLGALASSGSAGDKVRASSGFAIGGATLAGGSMVTYSSLRVDVAAVVEPDADGDFHGDETQDRCPTQTSTQEYCDTTGPVLSISRRKVQRSSKSFEFSVTSLETVQVTVTGSLRYTLRRNGRRISRTIPLAAVQRELAPAFASRFRYKLSSRARSALRKSGSLRASLTIASTDLLGNRSSDGVAVTIKPR